MEGVCPKTKGPELFPRRIGVVSSCVQSSGVNVPAPSGSRSQPESPVLSLASAWPQEHTDSPVSQMLWAGRGGPFLIHPATESSTFSLSFYVL